MFFCTLYNKEDNTAAFVWKCEGQPCDAICNGCFASLMLALFALPVLTFCCCSGGDFLPFHKVKCQVRRATCCAHATTDNVPLQAEHATSVPRVRMLTALRWDGLDEVGRLNAAVQGAAEARDGA
jgi:hypothetical protein